jgi:hypothetical protein
LTSEDTSGVDIALRRMGGQTWSVCAPPAATVGWLRASARAHLDVAPTLAVALCHRGAVLEDDAQSLRDAGVLLHPSVIAVPLPGKPRAIAAKALMPHPPLAAEGLASDGGDAGGGDARVEEDEDEAVCRICFDARCVHGSQLVAPCRCAGSMRFVHTACLAEWRTLAVGTRAFAECQTCRSPYAVRATRYAPLLRSEALLHCATALSLLLLAGLAALLPIPLERRFFALVEFVPWSWLARRGWALRALRGLLVVAATGLGEHMRLIMSRDVITRDACLRCLALSSALNGPRILRVLFVGRACATSASSACYLSAASHMQYSYRIDPAAARLSRHKRPLLIPAAPSLLA